MTYSAGQVVEVCSEQSKAWVSFGYRSKITLERLIPPDEGYAGQWEAVTATGVRGILSEEEFRPVPEHSPIVTETVRRIEPGVYGRLEVGFGTNGVSVGLTSEADGKAKFGTRLSAPELRELARVALEIAEYLEHVD